MDCFLCHRSNWMRQRTLDFLQNCLEEYKDQIGDHDIFIPLVSEEMIDKVADLLVKYIGKRELRKIWSDVPDDIVDAVNENGLLYVLKKVWNFSRTHREKFKKMLPAMFEIARRQPWEDEGAADLFHDRIRELQDTLKLSDLEVNILIVCLACQEDILTVQSKRYTDSSTGMRIYMASLCLKTSEAAIIKQLDSRKPLRRYHCIDNDLDVNYTLCEFFCGVTNEPLSSIFFKRNVEPMLPWGNFEDLTVKHGSILKRMLTCAEKPVNILFYGAPGTGKTSFAKTLVDEVGKKSFSIAQRTNEFGEQTRSTPDFRFGALQVCDDQVDSIGSVIIVDEADDMLRGQGSSSMMGGRPRGGNKGLLNNVLDELKTSTIWITNTDAEELDESSRRRFDYSICFAPLNSEQRKRIWKNNIVRLKQKRLFTDGLVDELADRYPVSAGGIAQTLENLVKLHPKKTEVPVLIDQLMKPHCELMGIELANDKLLPVKDYSLEGLNLHGDVKLERIVEAVRSFQKQGIGKVQDPDRPRMNLLLSGPPGTGKTEFVKYLGSVLKTKVNVKMGSDLLSMWVGGTEANIKQAFTEAEAEHSILFLDEIDGLVQSRTNAVRSWEVTQVNELLYWMENFNGVMIGATNFLQNLDQAIMRRFTFKLQFDFLDEAGKLAFFEKCFKTTLSGEERRRLAAIPTLAPGDFRTVRQSLFYYGGDVTNTMLLEVLEREAATKSFNSFVQHERIGF